MEGKKLGLIFCWIFLQSNCRVKQLVDESTPAPHSVLGHLSHQLDLGARGKYGIESWSVEPVETVLNHCNPNGLRPKFPNV